MIFKLLSLGIFLAGIAVSHAGAETVRVGRATIELPEGSWQALTTSEGETKLNGGVSGVLPMDDRAFVLLSGNQIMAILNVSSSKGGGPLVYWSNTCTGSDRTYAFSLTTNPNALECAEASGALKTDVILKLAMPNVPKAIEANSFVLPPVVQSTRATVGNDRGTSLHVNLLAVPAFIGIQGTEILNVPAPVKPGHAAWARQLVLAVKGSVYSLSGKMAVPPVNFAAPPSTPSTSQ